MPQTSQQDYHLARQRECQIMASRASTPSARIAHEALAHEHARRARAEQLFILAEK